MRLPTETQIILREIHSAGGEKCFAEFEFEGREDEFALAEKLGVVSVSYGSGWAGTVVVRLSRNGRIAVGSRPTLMDRLLNYCAGKLTIASSH